MALELPDDGVGGVSGKRHSPGGVKAVDGLYQPERSHLDEVVQRLAPVGKTARQVFRQTQMGAHQLVAQTAVAGLRVCEKLLCELFAPVRLQAHCPSPGASALAAALTGLAPFHQPELWPSGPVAHGVLVHQGVEYHFGQFGQVHGGRPGKVAVPIDGEAFGTEQERQLQYAVPALAPGKPETYLVYGQSQVLDLVESEAETTGEAGGGHPGQAQELGPGRDRQPHLVLAAHSTGLLSRWCMPLGALAPGTTPGQDGPTLRLAASGHVPGHTNGQG